MAAILNVRATVNAYRLKPDFADEMIKLLDTHVAEIHSTGRVSRTVLSIKTQEQRARALCKAFVELRKHGFALRTPYSLKKKHIEYLVKLWVSQGISGGRIENKLTYLRAFAGWIGKPGMVETLGNYVDKKENGLGRSYVATEDKSWDGHDVCAADKIDEIAKTCPRVAVQLKMQAALGMRVEESFMEHPEEMLREAIRNGGLLTVRRGTKGGRIRKVPAGPAQIEVLREAVELVNEMTGSTMSADRTLRQWRDWYYYVLKKHGVTKAGIGVTSHGLRHGCLQTLYKTVSGVPAPIKGFDDRPEPEQHLEAMRRVVETAGHSRRTKANAYLSTFATQDRKKREVITADQARAALERARGNKTHAAADLGISRQALYRALDAG
jgi:integrase